jgi:hypothetical protein
MTPRRRDGARDRVLRDLYRSPGNHAADRAFDGVLEAITLALEEPDPAARPTSRGGEG